MNEKQNTALVQQGYQLFSQRDIPGILKLLSPSVVWELPKLEGVPYTGKFQGIEGVGKFFTALADTVDILKYEPHEFIAQGDKVVVLGDRRYRVKDQREELEDRWVDVLTVENGKITRYEQYGDTALLERAMTAAHHTA